MKNKKGFTLVEIIAVIALIAVIVGIFIVNLVGKNDPKENNKDTVKQILSAADAYVSANKSEIEKLYEGYNFVDITIGDLMDYLVKILLIRKLAKSIKMMKLFVLL